MQLLAENGLVYVAIQPRAGHRSQTQVFHARYKTTNRAVPLNKINDGNKEVIAGRLTPKRISRSYRSLHDGCPQGDMNCILITQRKKRRNMNVSSWRCRC